MLASLSSELTFSQSLNLKLSATKSATVTPLNLRRRFFERQKDQKRQKQQQENQQNQSFERYNLHIPSSVRCPVELSPIESFKADPVPFAAALHNVRSRCLPTKVTFDADFEWMDTNQLNNSSGESSSRKVAAKELAKRDIDNYFFMYFRVRMENYINLVCALRQSAKDQSIFNEENLDRWTHKFKFKIRRAAPLKKCLFAFSGRLGIDDDLSVMYCTDGFYGDSFTGRCYNKNETPNSRVLPANTSLASGLKNGSNIYVSRIYRAEREAAFEQLKLDLQRENDPSDGEAEEGRASESQSPEPKSEASQQTK